MTKGTLKEKGRLLALGATTFFTTLAFIAGANAIYGNVKLSDYSNDEQVGLVATELDCDINYATKTTKKFTKMEHNGKDPIYVCFDDSLQSHEKEIAKKSLDYMFGIVGKINSNYRYEIVDKTKYNLSFLKTRIYFDIKEKVSKEHQDAEGYIDSTIGTHSFFTHTRTIRDIKIYQLKNYTEDESIKLRHLYTHELLHAFGIDDVYLNENTQKHQGNTFIHPGVGESIGMLTPNDIKVLVSLYLEKFDNEEEQKESINKHKEKIEAYEKAYYFNLTEKILSDLSLVDKIDMPALQWNGMARYQTPDGTIYQLKYKIFVDNDRYKFYVLDNDNNKLDFYQGEAQNINGVMVLKDLNLKQGLTTGIPGSPNGYVQDLFLVKEGSLLYLYDISNQSRHIGFTSKLYDYEKEF